MQIPQVVQNLSTQQLAALMQSQTGAMALQGEGGDFFALLLQMLTGLSEGGDNALLPLFTGQLEEQEEDPTDAMQLMAGMLDPTLLGLDSLPVLPDAAAADSQVVQLIGSLAGVDSQKAQQLYLLMQAAQERTAQQGKGENQPQQENGGFLELLEYSVREAAQQSPKGGQSSLQFGGSFRQAVTEAQRQLKAQGGGKEEEAVDIESLQSLADTRRTEIQQARSAAAREEPGTPPPLTEQVRTGVLQGLSQGRSEFTVKLRPEGLGEITVRLSEGTDGAMTLNLTASTEQTVRLLNQQLEGLREALRPYGTEVNPAVSQPQESSYADGSYTGAQFDAHQGQHAFYGQQSHGGHPVQDFLYEEEPSDTEMPESYPASELNAYI